MLSEKEILENLEKGVFINPDTDEVIDSSDKQIDHDNNILLKFKIEFLKKYENIFKKRTYDDFFKHFLIRYKNIEFLLKSRQELRNLTSISRLENKMEKDRVSVIGMVKEKSETKKGNIMLTVEDPTGEIKVLVMPRNEKLYKFAKDIVLDEILGISGSMGTNIIFSNSIICPDIPVTHELKKHPEEIYAAFIGDMHFGSRVFLEEEFTKMLSWLRGEIGSDKQTEIAKKIKYIFMTGDLVEGVGIYPGQEDDVDEKYHDIKKQYEVVASWLKKIPKDKIVIICPGNHDYGRMAEPQLPLTNEYSASLSKLKNVIQVSNPSFINFAKTDNFPGFNLILYHGGSLIYYSENVPSIRRAGGQKAVNQTMKFLLQRRHLAPTHGSTLYIPDPAKDFLFIDTIPDFFITGHIHRANVDSYRNITTINASCWTGKTEDQVKRGLEPQPAKLPIVNLHTRQVKIVNFLSEKHKGVMKKQ